MRASNSSTTARVLLVLAALCAVAAVWLSVDRPAVPDAEAGGFHTCAAPWDTALNGEAPNAPGGDLAAADATTNDCSEAGALRFQLAVTASAAAFFLLVGAGSARRGARPGPVSAPEGQDRRTAMVG